MNNNAENSCEKVSDVPKDIGIHKKQSDKKCMQGSPRRVVLPMLPSP